MPDGKSASLRTLLEEADPSLQHAPEIHDGLRRSSAGWMMAVMEGCAQYGASLGLPPVPAETVEKPRAAGGFVQVRALPARHPVPVATGLGKSADVHVFPLPLRNSPPVATAADKPAPFAKVCTWLIAVVKPAAIYMQVLLRDLRREREVEQSIVQLSEVEDRILQDIGLCRVDVAHTVRHGGDARAAWTQFS